MQRDVNSPPPELFKIFFLAPNAVAQAKTSLYFSGKVLKLHPREIIRINLTIYSTSLWFRVIIAVLLIVVFPLFEHSGDITSETKKKDTIVKL